MPKHFLNFLSCPKSHSVFSLLFFQQSHNPMPFLFTHILPSNSATFYFHQALDLPKLLPFPASLEPTVWCQVKKGVEGKSVSPLSGAALLIHGWASLKGSLTENSNRLKDQKTVIPASLLYASSPALNFGVQFQYRDAAIPGDNIMYLVPLRKSVF